MYPIENKMDKEKTYLYNEQDNFIEKIIKDWLFSSRLSAENFLILNSIPTITIALTCASYSKLPTEELEKFIKKEDYVGMLIASENLVRMNQGNKEMSEPLEKGPTR